MATQIFQGPTRPTTDTRMFQGTGTVAPVGTQGPINPPKAPMQGPMKPVKPIQPSAMSNVAQPSIADRITANVADYRARNNVTAPTVGAEDIGVAGVTIQPQPEVESQLSGSLASVDTTTDTFGTEGQQGAEVSNRDRALEALFSNFQDQQAFDPTAIKEAEGVYQQREIVNQLSQGYDKAITEQRRTLQEMRKNPEGKLRGANQADMQNFKYESDQNLADKAMALHYARADYDSVNQIAQDAINAQTQKFNQTQAFFSNLYTALGDDLTASEKITFASNLQQHKDYVQGLQSSKTEAVRFAIESGAPAEVVTAIKNAQTEGEVWTAAGQYGVDPMRRLEADGSRLDQAYKAAQIRSLSQTKAALAPTSVIEQGGRKILVNTQTGEVVRDFGEVDFAGNSTVEELAMVSDTASIQQIENIKSHKGLNSAVGPQVFGRLNFVDWATGADNDFIASVDNLTKGLTLDSLIDAKAQGATFGALSNQELKLLAESATKINNWRKGDTDSEGAVTQTTHFDVAEKDFMTELDRIANYRKLDSYLRYRERPDFNPADVGIVETADGIYAKNGDGSVTKLR